MASLSGSRCEAASLDADCHAHGTGEVIHVDVDYHVEGVAFHWRDI